MYSPHITADSFLVAFEGMTWLIDAPITRTRVAGAGLSFTKESAGFRSQYTSDEYQQQLRTMGITCSMSRTGCCYDNAVMERFFWSLKHEWTNFEDFADLNEARLSVFEYIEAFYNSKRIHQTLGYKTPNQFEEIYQINLAV